MTSLDDIRRDASRTFPMETLEGTRQALCVFAAAFYGRNDVVHLRDVPFVTVIDSDAAKLEEMRLIYRNDPKRVAWSWLARDVYEFPLHLERADLVVVDPWQHDMERAHWFIKHWTSLSRRWLVIGSRPRHSPDIPAGWTLRRTIVRNGATTDEDAVTWLVLRRDDS